ncbi:MAG: zinc-finger domain-containing protein [Gammaproteobacteria bacterium]|nr:zinc-finger domain-containing protein [Gammaproteobacteria bacterium]
MSEQNSAGDANGGDRTPNAYRQHEVTADDLPLHCPLPGTTLWNSHPRVYLPIEDTGEERCPYCGTVYVLKK